MKRIQSVLKNRLDQVTRPEPTITIYRGAEFYITDTGEQERADSTHIRFSVRFREKQLGQLKGPALAVFICLGLHIGEDGTCFPSVSLISQQTGYNRDTVFKELKRLEFMGYIARKQKIDPQSRKFRSNVYQLFPKSVTFKANSRGGK